MPGNQLYTNEYFYGGYGQTNHQEFLITDSDIEKIKGLLSKKMESSYYNSQVVWSLEDNPQIKNGEEMSRLYVCMQFISMIANPSQLVIDKHQVKDHHMQLLRRLYLEYDDYDTEDSIMMGYKRPFGNSYVLGDVQEELIKCGIIDGDDDGDDDSVNNVYRKNIAECVLEEFGNFLVDFYKDFTIDYYSFIFDSKFDVASIGRGPRNDWSKIIKQRPHNYLRDWKIDPSDVRNRKINMILE